MKILMVASEATPFVKTGGLADVMGSLPAALVKGGDEVTVVLPRYRSASIEARETLMAPTALSLGARGFDVSASQVIRDGVRYAFVECPPLFDRAEIYGTYPDNHIRFALLNVAAIEIGRLLQPHILHTHDWHAGLAGVYLKTNFTSDPAFLNTRVVFTIHNLGYQGNFPAPSFADLGLDPSLYHPEGLEFWGNVSFLKAGIHWADAITTVSPTYAREILTAEYGFGMEGVLQAHASRLSGILNGADYDEWNPATDPHLAANYSAAGLAGKLECKRAVLGEMGLPNTIAGLRRPLIGIISRFAAQKGFDLLPAIETWLARQDVALAALGSGEREIERMFLRWAGTYPQQVAVKTGYNAALAHRIEAGADMFLMPSHYEPCGLNQMYSMRYGTVPIVRATGGLEDSVDEQTGFKFRDYTSDALAGAISDALDDFGDPDSWVAKMLAGMRRDFSWDASANAYRSLYRRLSGSPEAQAATR